MKVLKQPSQITLFGRAMCSWCDDAKAWLKQRGWNYTHCDTGVDPSAKKQAIALSGQTYVPVIVVDGHVLGDFDTCQLEEFLRKHRYLE